MHRGLLVIVFVGIIAGGVALVWVALQEPDSQQFEADLISAADLELPTFGFMQITENYEWQFPRDFAPHPQYQREQWRIESIENCSVTFSVLFERISILPENSPSIRTSDWTPRSILTADLEINSDLESRASRNVLGLAQTDKNRVWVEDWSFDWQSGLLVAGSLHLSLKLESPENPTSSAGWGSYTRLGSTDSGCQIRLTHRFGTPG